MPLLEVTDLKKQFQMHQSPFKNKGEKRVLAVDGVSFSIEKAETVGLVGESGCGKTTIAKMILGFIKPDNGQIYIQGTDIWENRRRSIRKLARVVQIVFQDPYGSLNPKWPVGQIVQEGITIHESSLKAYQVEQRVCELLMSVGLDPDCKNRYPHEFSGGQRQRIGIARALSVKPQFIVADEPVSSLDVSVQAGIINLLIDLQKSRGISYLFISHDLSVVRHISHRILVMNKGRIVESGDTEEIFENPKNPYTQKLLESIYDIK